MVAQNMTFLVYLSFTMWFMQASKKHVKEAVAKEIHERVAPVVNWLRTAEVESEEEEEEDVEIVYSEKASKNAVVAETVQEPAEVSHFVSLARAVLLMNFPCRRMVMMTWILMLSSLGPSCYTNAERHLSNMILNL